MRFHREAPIRLWLLRRQTREFLLFGETQISLTHVKVGKAVKEEIISCLKVLCHLRMLPAIENCGQYTTDRGVCKVFFCRTGPEPGWTQKKPLFRIRAAG